MSSLPRGEGRRELIVDATLRVIAEEGVQAVTHRRVASEAGLPLAATTYWFDSKESLLTETFATAADRDIEQIQRVVAEFSAQPDGDLAATLATPLLDGLAEGRTMLMACYVLAIESTRRPALRPIQERWGSAYVEAFESLLSAAGSSQPGSHARILLATLDGLLLHNLTASTKDTATEMLAFLEKQVSLLLADEARGRGT